MSGRISKEARVCASRIKINDRYIRPNYIKKEKKKKRTWNKKGKNYSNNIEIHMRHRWSYWLSLSLSLLAFVNIGLYRHLYHCHNCCCHQPEDRESWELWALRIVRVDNQFLFVSKRQTPTTKRPDCLVIAFVDHMELHEWFVRSIVCLVIPIVQKPHEMPR